MQGRTVTIEAERESCLAFLAHRDRRSAAGFFATVLSSAWKRRRALRISQAFGGCCIAALTACSSNEPTGSGSLAGMQTDTTTLSGGAGAGATGDTTGTGGSTDTTTATASGGATAADTSMVDTSTPASGGAPAVGGSSAVDSGGTTSVASQPPTGAGGSAVIPDAMSDGGAGGQVPDAMSGGAGGADSGAAGAPMTDAGGSGSVDDAVVAPGSDFAAYDPANPPGVLTVSGATDMHDPTVIEADGTFYLYRTGIGPGIAGRTSSDLLNWSNEGTVFNNPSWVSSAVPRVNNLWAPDVSYFGGQYHLYYSASTFGENRSCIGHATTGDISQNNWTDQGSVVCSNCSDPSAHDDLVCSGGNDNWNAIDPNIFVDDDGTKWMSFGSFWSGIKLIQLDDEGKRANSDLHALSTRPNSVEGAVEAPIIVKRGNYYYLFVSFDKCCQGSDSTYKIAAGRSTSVTGPYLDANGTDLVDNGGTIIVQGDDRWRGPGHNFVLFTETRAYNVYHAYDAQRNGASTLRIADLVWDEQGWPISGGP